MRAILSLVLTATATLLLCHGLFLDEPAQRAHALSPTPLDTRPARQFPYAQATIEARKAGGFRIGHPLASAEGFDAGALLPAIQASFQESPPFLQPMAAAALALLLLVITLVLPRTRLRSLVVLSLLLGGAAVAPLFLPLRTLDSIVADAPLLLPVVAYAPWSAIGLLYLAALGLAVSTRPKERTVERIVLAQP